MFVLLKSKMTANNTIPNHIAKAITDKVNKDYPMLKMGTHVKHGGLDGNDFTYHIETTNGRFKISQEAVTDFNSMNTVPDYSKVMAKTYKPKN